MKQEFVDILPIPFLFAGEAEDDQTGARRPGVAISPNLYTVQTSEDDWLDHGTGVASKVAGKTLGTAKKAKLVSVKWPVPLDNSDTATQVHVTSVMDAFRKISRDIQARQASANRVGWAIINMSFGVAPAPEVEAQIRDWMQQFINNDVVLVTSSGNCRGKVNNDCPLVSSISCLLTISMIC
jgi:hypothetical protein